MKRRNNGLVRQIYNPTEIFYNKNLLCEFMVWLCKVQHIISKEGNSLNSDFLDQSLQIKLFIEGLCLYLINELKKHDTFLLMNSALPYLMVRYFSFLRTAQNPDSALFASTCLLYVQCIVSLAFTTNGQKRKNVDFKTACYKSG